MCSCKICTEARTSLFAKSCSPALAEQDLAARAEALVEDTSPEPDSPNSQWTHSRSSCKDIIYAEAFSLAFHDTTTNQINIVTAM